MSHNRVEDIRRFHHELPVFNLVRRMTGIEGTFGHLYLPGATLVTGELPWHDNKPNISCIPYGEYICEIAKSPRFGSVYHLLDVKDRSHILIHSGNFAADKESGLRSDVEGCIVLGMRFGEIYGQKAVASSKSSMEIFYDKTGRKPFKLVVSGFLPMDADKKYVA